MLKLLLTHNISSIHLAPSISTETTLVSLRCPCVHQSYVTHNGIDQNVDQPPYGSDMESDMSEEDAYNLEDISSDVEIPPEELQDIEDDAA